MGNHDTDRSVEIKLGSISIEWLDGAPRPPCATCGREVGEGPVGFKKDDPAGPVCDRCLLDLNPDLGMLLWLANIVREAADLCAGHEDRVEVLMLPLMTFARIYHRGSEWPHRMPTATTTTEDLRASLARVPWDAIFNLLTMRTR